jgi:transcriptional regulator with XRE-family HTH domain
VNFNSPNRAREALAANLRKMRQERNLSQEALASLAGIHRNYLGGIERCERNVGLDNLQKLADALSVTVAELVG